MNFVTNNAFDIGRMYTERIIIGSASQEFLAPTTDLLIYKLVSGCISKIQKLFGRILNECITSIFRLFVNQIENNFCHETLYLYGYTHVNVSAAYF